MITSNTLASAVGADAVRDEDRLAMALSVASSKLATALESAWRPMPDDEQDLCVLRLAIAIYKSIDNDNGGMLTTADGTLVPGQPNDPMVKVWPLIRRYVNRV